MRLFGKNFQSWADFDMQIEGLTVLIGPSDVGKSALFRALKGVVRNELPAEFVRDGQDEPMEVTLQAGSHTIAARRKRKGSTTYVIDGQDFAKLAGGIPDQLKDLKFGEVVIGDFDFDPIFGRQNSAQFLIDPLTYKPTEVNAILGAFGGTEKLEHGKKEANLRKTQKDAEARTLSEQIRSAEERKAKLASMQLEGSQISGVLHDLEDGIRVLEIKSDILQAIVRYRQEIDRYRQIIDALAVPDIAGLEREHRLAAWAEQAAETHAYARWLAKPIATLAGVTACWDEVASLRNEIATLESARRAGGFAEWLSASIGALQAAPALWGGIRSLWNEIAALEAAVEAGKHVVSTDRLKSALSDAESRFNESVRLWNSIKRLEALAALLGELSDSANRLAGVETELSAAQAEIQRGLCPKCGKPMEHVCV